MESIERFRIQELIQLAWSEGEFIVGYVVTFLILGIWDQYFGQRLVGVEWYARLGHLY
jgi:multisubunit Na+/H+ antiporter MnhE subunit